MADFITAWMSAFGSAKISRPQRLLLSDLLLCASRDGAVTCRLGAGSEALLDGLVASGWLAPLQWRNGCLRTSLTVPEALA